jgi:hypothetical protein
MSRWSAECAASVSGELADGEKLIDVTRTRVLTDLFMKRYAFATHLAHITQHQGAG